MIPTKFDLSIVTLSWPVSLIMKNLVLVWDWQEYYLFSCSDLPEESATHHVSNPNTIIPTPSQSTQRIVWAKTYFIALSSIIISWPSSPWSLIFLWYIFSLEMSNLFPTISWFVEQCRYRIMTQQNVLKIQMKLPQKKLWSGPSWVKKEILLPMSPGR